MTILHETKKENSAHRARGPPKNKESDANIRASTSANAGLEYDANGRSNRRHYRFLLLLFAGS